MSIIAGNSPLTHEALRHQTDFFRAVQHVIGVGLMSGVELSWLGRVYDQLGDYPVAEAARLILEQRNINVKAQ